MNKEVPVTQNHYACGCALVLAGPVTVQLVGVAGRMCFYTSTSQRAGGLSPGKKSLDQPGRKLGSGVGP